MTQDERWLTRYNEVKAFIETNHRNPSRHRIEEHDMLNWIKANRKKMNAGELKPERIVIFQSLLNLIEENKRKNQYEWPWVQDGQQCRHVSRVCGGIQAAAGRGTCGADACGVVAQATEAGDDQWPDI